MKKVKVILIIIAIIFGIGIIGSFSSNIDIEDKTTTTEFSKYSNKKTTEKNENTVIPTSSTTNTKDYENITNKTTTTAKPTTTKTTTTNNNNLQGEYVWIPNSGIKYHRRSSCSNMKNPSKVTISEAKSLGFTPCGKCY